MALTPNYSWPTPDNTDLVKDGAEAIRDLGNAIDNTVNSLPSGGLVHINTTSFSGVASVSLTADTFTSTYTNYRIMISELYGVADGNAVSLRLRKAGTDNTTAASYIRKGYAAGATLGLTSASDTSFFLTIVNSGSTVPSSGFVDIFQPKANNQTNFVTNFYDANNEQAIGQAGRHSVVDTFDSITILSGTNLTGTVSVYAYNK